LLATRLGVDAELAFLESASRGAFEVFPLAIEHLPRVQQLVEKYRSLPMDLADASLVILAEEPGSDRTRPESSRSATLTIASSNVSSSGMPLERINLNVPSETRRRLRAVAKRLKKTESEIARDLLIEALRREEKEEFYRRVSEQMTPELRQRLLEIADAFEGLDD
jgi:hypothetical protein